MAVVFGAGARRGRARPSSLAEPSLSRAGFGLARVAGGAGRGGGDRADSLVREDGAAVRGPRVRRDPGANAGASAASREARTEGENPPRGRGANGSLG